MDMDTIYKILHSIVLHLSIAKMTVWRSSKTTCFKAIFTTTLSRAKPASVSAVYGNFIYTLYGFGYSLYRWTCPVFKNGAYTLYYLRLKYDSQKLKHKGLFIINLFVCFRDNKQWRVWSCSADTRNSKWCVQEPPNAFCIEFKSLVLLMATALLVLFEPFVWPICKI